MNKMSNERLAEMIANAQSEAVAVKALEWTPIGPNGSDVEAETILGEYTLSFDAPSAGGAVNMWVAGADKDLFEVFDSVRAAKAAAQADYEQRIRSALTHPAPPLAVTDEMVEAGCAKYAWARYGGTVVWPRDFSPKEISESRENMRAALTAALEAKQ